jgi:hypothetical protein
VVTVLDERHAHIFALQRLRQVERGFPWHVRVLLAVQQADRAMQRNRAL